MSIINKVLKDLDKRQQYDDSNEQTGSAVAKAPQRRWFAYVAIVLLVVLAAAAVLAVKGELDSDERVQPEPEERLEEPQEPEPVVTDDLPTQQTLAEEEVPEVTHDRIEPTRKEPTDDMSPIAETVPASSERNTDRRDRTPNQTAAAQLNSEQADKTPEPESKRGVFEKRSVTLSAEELAQRALVKAEDAKNKGLFSDAANYYREALEAKPGWHDVRKEWAALEYGRGQLSRALAVVREGLSQYPEAASLRLLAANMLQKQGETRVALQLLRQLTPSATELPAYYQLQAELAQQLNDAVVMQQSYERLTEAEPDNGRWYLGLALALREQDPERAITLFEQSAALIEHQPTLEYIAQQIHKLREVHEASTP